MKTVEEPRLTFGRTVASEWIKFRSVRSNWYFILTLLALMAGFGVLSAAVASGDVETATASGAPNLAAMDPTTLVLAGSAFGILIVGVMGALLGAREYASGQIRSTFSAVPKRTPVLAAKLLVFLAVVTPVAVAALAVAFFAGMAVLAGGGLKTAELSDPGVARAVIGTALYLLGLGIIGLALGVLLRSITGSIAVLIGVVLILPGILGLLLPAAFDGALKYLPSNAGASFSRIVPLPGMLDAGTGAWVFAAWVIVLFAGAMISLKIRDV